MLRTRVMPCLLLNNKSLVKTVAFNKFEYIGDPCNTVRIFNELEVDEMVIIDIQAAKNRTSPNIKLISEVANEAFMPLSYGGGVSTLTEAIQVIECGFEKVILNTALVERPELANQIANSLGSQSLIAGLDVKRSLFSKKSLRTFGGQKKCKLDILEWAKELEDRGVGEILLTSIDNEGSWKGFDLELIEMIGSKLNIPVIAHGGAGCIDDLRKAKHAGADAIAIGSMVVFQKSGLGVLINFPSIDQLENIL